MKTVRFVAWVLPLAVIALGCERSQGPDRVVDPAPEASAPEVLEARWVWEKGLNDALQSAAVSPLVQRAVMESPHPGAKPVWSMAVRAEGQVTGGKKVGVTILPYSVGSDPTHALFVSLYEHDGQQIAEPAELIAGRKPTDAETGFEPIWQGDRYVYVKTGAPYAIGAAGPYRLSPERRNWAKFFQCFAQRAPQYCASGASMAREMAPNYPHAAAVGCGVGVAYAGVECFFGAR
jgi:hypothetical protein